MLAVKGLMTGLSRVITRFFYKENILENVSILVTTEAASELVL